MGRGDVETSSDDESNGERERVVREIAVEGWGGSWQKVFGGRRGKKKKVEEDIAMGNYS
jgi:hypothetical protein